MHKIPDWQFSENGIKGCTGSQIGVIPEIYSQRLDKYVSNFVHQIIMI